ncbi:MAG: phosphatidylglycerol lysyltransferase domain-containing protein [Desulfobacterales bacterium]
MPWQFDPITLDRQSAYREKLALMPEKASDYSFINLWGWSEEHGLQWSWQEGCAWILQTLPTPSLWAPVGAWQSLNWTRLLAEGPLAQMPMARIPQQLADVIEAQLGRRAILTPARGHWDYLYSVADLTQLKGKRFHKKKNLLNQFLRNYEFSYQPLTARESAHALALQEDWCQWRDCEAQDALAAENRVIQKLFQDWEQLEGITGGALSVGERMVAYTIAEALTPEMLVIHIEKGDPDYKGAYQAINQIFLAQTGTPYRTVNREQDLGNEGLRKAKLSYNPLEFIEKYTAHFRPD